MPICRICGEEKVKEDFYHIPNFLKYKKNKVIWCRYCQKLWLDMRKQREYTDKYLNTQQSFSVSFE